MLDQKPGNSGRTTEATGQREKTVNQGSQGDGPSPFAAPSISLPKGGGAIRGIGEKFAANPVTGTGSMTVPVAVSPGRSGFAPQLALSYDSGAGNGPFGLGWNLSLPSITRKTDKGLPKYQDAEESDVFILSGAEDLVPVLDDAGDIAEVERDGYRIRSYRPRIEGLFARIERWSSLSDGETHWRSISKDNLLTIYGKDLESRVADPLDPRHIFSWLICETRDDKGNGIVYEYAGENSVNVDLSQVNEANRGNVNSPLRTANRYIKHIRYGNKTSLLDNTGKRPLFLTGDALDKDGWMFEVVFDYGDEPYIESLPDAEERVFVQSTISDSPGQSWPRRRDPFSTYRSGFEVRTYRLCRRALMFHHFPADLGIDDYLVRSTEFAYDEKPIASFITSVTQSGYLHQQNDSYLKKSLPPVDFVYSKAEIQNEVRELDAESLENLPAGLDGANYQWIDLDGDGVAGILTEQAGAWFYKRNLSPIPTIQENGATHTVAKLAPLETVAVQPSFNGISGGGMQFLDLAGDGRPDLVQFEGSAPGFFEHTDDDVWESHRPFTSLPNVNWRDPNLKFVDLTGDGHADILISEDEVFTWYPSLAEDGFGPSVRVHNPFDEEKGPRLVFADSRQSVFLADLSGDGLTDIVRIRNGEVCYWPNLGYGRFGAKVVMDGSPWFDTPDIFDQRRIRLADIDGSGVTDIIYLGNDGIHIYFNQSGNSWSEARELDVFPTTDNLSSVTVVDLLGNGTACLVWSSPLPGHARRPMLYVDLMGGLKPHLMILSRNNLGAETRVHYAPSTKFYLEDKYAGKPWITKLPFPVHVVERVETVDYISRNRFVTRHAYHHGYFDGEEREFRGFGMVEQWDTESFAALSASGTLPGDTNIDSASHVPPVYIKTWFHTGAFGAEGRISKQFEKEYYREGDTSLGQAGLTNEQLAAMMLRDTEFPTDRLMPDGARVPYSLSAEEAREACRSLKGSILRIETYAQDCVEESDRPYTVSERNYTIELLQPRDGARHAVFFTHARESIDFHYERKLFDVAGEKVADPRVTHTLTLDVDNYGNVLRSASVAYGRRLKDAALSPDDQKKQGRTHVTFSENVFTKPILESGDYRTPLPCESRTYELLKVRPLSNIQGVTNIFRLDELDGEIASVNNNAATLPYQEWDADEDALPAARRRLIEHVRTLYRKNDLSGPLPLADLESLALPYEAYKLAFTPGLATDIFKRDVNGVEENLIPDQTALLGKKEDGGYVHSEGDANWWIPSGQIFYSPNETDSAVQELSFARQHFFQPRRFRDPFGQSATIDYAYDLLLKESRDPLGNTVLAENDFRVLAPRLLIDPNGNRSFAKFDALGLVVATAVRGKVTENFGDSVDDFTDDDANPTLAQLQNFMTDPRANASARLKSATSRIIYDVDRYRREGEPSYAATLARETHASDPLPPDGLKIQISFSYSDGFGREIQKKIQAEPGRLDPDDPNLPVINPRWVGSGWTIFNNKGKPVRQYEPFFTDRHRFEFDARIGVSPVLFYDPVERVVGTLHPNHTWEKVVFDAWRQETSDVNDTVSVADPKSDADVGDFFRRLANGDYLPTWYALRTDAAHAAAFAAQYPNPTDRANETQAAEKTRIHAATPTVAHADSLGRSFLTVAHNKFKYSNTPPADLPVEDFYRTRVLFDIEGNQREVMDERKNSLDVIEQRVVMQYDYDMLGNRIHQASMEAGQRWSLNDVTGKTIRAWDSRAHEFRTAYDRLRRPTESLLFEGAAIGLTTERTVYGESRPNPETDNLRGKVVQRFDQAGVVTSDKYDFKGNLLSSQRQLAVEYKRTLDWSTAVPLETTAPYTSHTRYDALNRPTELTAPDDSVVRPTYNEANLLERVEVNLHGAAAATTFVHDIDYDAKGQRQMIEYRVKDDAGADQIVRTRYTYDPDTFRLTHLSTERPHFPNGERLLQDLSYSYDPAGNITHIRDNAQQTIFFRNQRVEPSAEYTYDATYRLIEATGREHLGQTGGQPNAPTAPDAFNGFHTRLDHPNDGNAMGTYLERYVYDAVGNILSMQHRGSDPVHAGWTRSYVYDEDSQLELGKKSNRLSSTTIGATTDTYSTNGNGYDAHGNMLRMPHLPLMQWDESDQLQATSQQVVNNGTPEATWYVYDSGGQRVRKVTDGQAAAGVEPVRVKERIYLGSYEIYREYESNGAAVKLERQTLHIMDDKRRIALVETRTKGNDPAPRQLIRYQFGNHLGSVGLELDGKAQIITYEEYTPYGCTSYQGVRSQAETPKRYRYTGRERDEESGLYYHGARYYAPWLARWFNADPIGLPDGVNLYCYVHDRPVNAVDPSGTQGVDIGDDPGLQAAARELHDARPDLAASPPTSSSPRRTVSYAEARAEANAGARRFRSAQGLSGSEVQAGHTQAARHVSESGASAAQTNDPATFQELHSRRGRGLDVTVTDAQGNTVTRTRHTAQEGLIDDAVERARAGGRLTPEGQAAAGEEVLWRTQGTGLDQREVRARRASGLFDESAAIERSPAVQAHRARRAGGGGSGTPAVPHGGGGAAAQTGRGSRALARTRAALGTAGRAVEEAAPTLTRVARTGARGGARVLGAVGRVAGPLAVAESSVRLATATNNLDRLQAGADTVAGVAAYAGPVGEAFAVGYGAGQLLDTGVELATGESLSSRGARGMTAVDQAVSSVLPANPSLPEYKQQNRIAWWLIDTFNL